MAEQIGSTTGKTRGFGRESLPLIDEILGCLDQAEGPMTVRQVFYAMSVRGAVVKTEAGYRRVQRLLVELRRRRHVPYQAIADGTRWMRKPHSYEGLEDWAEFSAQTYRQSVWAGAGARVEVWCEKDALAGVIYPVTAEYDVPLMVTRGYSSESFAYEAAQQMLDAWTSVYYLGDLDASGWQMAEDLEKRLENFGALVHFWRLAVNPDQVRAWALPSRPPKKADPRHERWARLFPGLEATELDAIPPAQLRTLVRKAIEKHLPAGVLDQVRREEEAARAVIKALPAQLRGKGKR